MKKLFFMAVIAIFSSSSLLAQKIEFYTSGIVRVTRDNGEDASKKVSLVVTATPEKVAVVKKSEDGKTVYTTDQLKVTVENGKVSFADSKGNLLMTEGEYAFTPRHTGPDCNSYKVKQTFSVEPDEAIYGIGMLQNGKLNQRGEQRRMEQTNTEDYAHFYQSIKGYGVYWDNYSPTFISVPENGIADELVLESEVGDIIDYYFIYGGDADGVIAGMRHLSGKVPMAPLWTYGFHQSRERYATQSELLEVVDKYRDLKIPYDGIVQDWEYWGNPFLWNAMEFLAEGFPEPQKMIDHVHDQNAHISISVWQSFGIGTKPYRELARKGHLLDFETFPPSGLPGWPPRDDYPSGSRVYDAYSAEARDIYWKNLSRLHRMGVDCWWMDSSDPDFYNENDRDLDVPTALGSLRSVRNAYPLMTVEGVYNHQRDVDSTKRAFIFTRSYFAGQQRTGANTWSGDVASTWDAMRKQIPVCLNFTLTANPNVHSDISGFLAYDYNTNGWGSAKDNPQFRELYVRWMQFGAFMTMMRSHGTATPREIYLYGKKGEPVYDALVDAVKLRYRFLPYIYSHAWQVSKNDDSFMRALFMDFKNDKNTWDINDEFMFGRNVLVCPVGRALFTPEEIDKSGKFAEVDWNATKTYDVYLPEGIRWYDFWTGDLLDGGQTIAADAPISRCPLYVKEGSILPLGPDVQYANENKYDNIDIVVYPGKDASFLLYEDEGDNYNYEKGKYSTILLKWDDKAKRLTIGKRSGSFDGMPLSRKFNVKIVGDDKVREIRYNGNPISVK